MTNKLTFDCEQDFFDVVAFERLDQQDGVVPLFRQFERGDLFQALDKCFKFHGPHCKVRGNRLQDRLTWRVKTPSNAVMF